jgi:hypothetical protein
VIYISGPRHYKLNKSKMPQTTWNRRHKCGLGGNDSVMLNICDYCNIIFFFTLYVGILQLGSVLNVLV